MTRDEIQTLLPFLANGTLNGEERAEIEAAVAADPALQSELAALQAIRDTMQAEEHFSPGEMGLARLMRDVDATAPVRAAPASRPVLWQIAAALLLAVVLGQAFIMSRSSDPGGFQLAGSEPGFEITLSESATEAEIRALLLEAGVEIIAGPSALGLYQLQPIEGVTPDQARSVLAESDLIESLSDPSQE